MRILIVDDEASMRLAMQETLRRSGYEVITAGDGQDGLLKLKEDGVQLVITDMKMPKMSGLQVLQVLRRVRGDERQQFPGRAPVPGAQGLHQPEHDQEEDADQEDDGGDGEGVPAGPEGRSRVPGGHGARARGS